MSSTTRTIQPTIPVMDEYAEPVTALIALIMTESNHPGRTVHAVTFASMDSSVYNTIGH